MNQRKLEELQEFAETYFDEECTRISLTRGKLVCVFMNSRFAKQYVKETKDIKDGWRDLRYDKFDFAIDDNVVTVTLK